MSCKDDVSFSDQCERQRTKTHLGTIRAPVSRHVAHDLREILRVFDDVDVPEHLEVGKFGRDAGDA